MNNKEDREDKEEDGEYGEYEEYKHDEEDCNYEDINNISRQLLEIKIINKCNNYIQIEDIKKLSDLELCLLIDKYTT